MITARTACNAIMTNLEARKRTATEAWGTLAFEGMDFGGHSVHVYGSRARVKPIPRGAETFMRYIKAFECGSNKIFDATEWGISLANWLGLSDIIGNAANYGEDNWIFNFTFELFFRQQSRCLTQKCTDLGKYSNEGVFIIKMCVCNYFGSVLYILLYIRR